MASHTTKNAKQPAADKPLTIEEIRTQDGFLPQYSDYYFEKQTTVEFLILFGLGILCATSFSFSLAYDYENPLWNILLPLSVLLTVFSIVFLKWGRKEQKTSGFYLEPTEIRKETFFSIPDNISYETVDQAVADGDIRYTTTGLVIGSGKNRLVFHYEIGDANAQHQVKSCYTLLQKRIHSKLPPFNKKGLDLLDRRYYYRQSMRQHAFCLLFELLFFSLLYICTELDLFTYGCLAFFFGMCELFSLYMFYQAAKLDARNQKLLQAELNELPNLNLGYCYIGYLFFSIVAALLLLANTLVILLF